MIHRYLNLVLITILESPPPPSIGIGQQCINAFGYHGDGVATTYILYSMTSVERLSVAEFRDE